jgi:Flp pilus assembly protein TadD
MKANRAFLTTAAIAAAVVVIAYSNSLNNSFHFDDNHVIVKNVFIRSLHNIPRFFRDAHTFSALPSNATYRPLVTLTYAIDYYLGGGLDPLQFHVSQIALLLVTWGMLIVFYRKALNVSRPSPRNIWIALTSATLFALHTVNTETLNLISARSEELAAIAILAAFLMIQFLPRARRWHLYLVPIAAGAMAKAQIVAFVPLLFAYLILIERQSVRSKKTWTAVLPALITGVAILVVLNKLNAPEWTPGGASRWRYFITQGLAWMHYSRLFFLPVGLSADTDWKPFEHWYAPPALAGFVFIALLLALIRYLAAREETQPVAFGLSWYVIALLPTSSIYALAEVVNEHRVFLPYMGLSLAVVFWLDIALKQHRAAFAAITIGAIIALSAGTMVRNTVWATEETLWKDTADKSPNNCRALMNYGLTQMAKGNYAVAKSYYERAETWCPAYPVLEINLGVVEGALGNNAVAESHFKRAMSLQDDADVHYYYARWLVHAGRATQAIPQLVTAVKMDSAHAESRSLLMKLYALTGSTAELMRLGVEARAYDPRDAEAAAAVAGAVPVKIPCRTARECFSEGAAAIQEQQFLEAALANREAIRHDQSAGDAWTNLGWSLAQIGLDSEAEQAFQRALELKPDDENARGNLQWLRNGKSAQR